MKTSKQNKLLSLALVGSCSLFSATNVFAAAGDDIANRATLSYSVGGTGQADIGSSPTGNTTGAGTDTIFQEDRLINFTVARTATTSVAPSALAQSVVFTITNNGNAAQNFLLRAEQLVGAADPFGGANSDIFTPTNFNAFVEDGTTPGYQVAEDTAIHVSDLASGGVVTVYVVADMPATRTDLSALLQDDISVASLVAQVALPTTPIVGSGEVAGSGVAADAITNDDNNNFSPGGTFQVTGGSTTVALGTANNIGDTDAMETVFDDPAGAGGAASAARTGEHADASTYTMTVPVLTVTKTSAAHFDDINLNSNPKAIPGSNAIVRYTVSIANAVGAGDATLTQIADVLSLVLDTQFGDATPANGPVSGANNVRVTDGAGAVVFCLADNGDANVDGCRDDGAPGTALVVDLTTVAGITNVLTAGQTLTIEFDVIFP
jgi:hypothetical protein